MARHHKWRLERRKRIISRGCAKLDRREERVVSLRRRVVVGIVILEPRVRREKPTSESHMTVSSRPKIHLRAIAMLPDGIPTDGSHLSRISCIVPISAGIDNYLHDLLAGPRLVQRSHKGVSEVRMTTGNFNEDGQDLKVLPDKRW
jgi:hypothetical protein